MTGLRFALLNLQTHRRIGKNIFDRPLIAGSVGRLFLPGQSEVAFISTWVKCKVAHWVKQACSLQDLKKYFSFKWDVSINLNRSFSLSCMITSVGVMQHWKCRFLSFQTGFCFAKLPSLSILSWFSNPAQLKRMSHVYHHRLVMTPHYVMALWKLKFSPGCSCISYSKNCFSGITWTMILETIGTKTHEVRFMA